MVIFLDFSNKLFYRSNIFKNNICQIGNKFREISHSFQNKITKLGLNNFDCFWILDNKQDVTL